MSDAEQACDSPLVTPEEEVPQFESGQARVRLVVLTFAGLLVACACVAMRSPHMAKEVVVNGMVSAASREMCSWHSKGQGTYCRIDPEDDTWTGDGTTIHKWNLESLDACKQACEEEELCLGIEFHHGFSGSCELWIKPIGHWEKQEGGWQQDLNGMYECLSYDCEAKDACGAQVSHWCEASEEDCHVLVPDAQHIAHLFPNECGKDSAFEYVMHFHNDKSEEVTVEADTCDPENTIFDTTISFFRPSDGECENVHCNDDQGAEHGSPGEHQYCSARTCVEGGQFKQNSYCNPEYWIMCCSKLRTTVPADGQLVIVVSSYHATLHTFKEGKTPGFKLSARVVDAGKA